MTNQTDATTKQGTDGQSSTSTSTSSNNNGPNKNNYNNDRRHSNNNKNTNARSTNHSKYWKGKILDIGCVIGLKSNVLEYKESFKEYKKGVRDYILRENAELGRFLVAPSFEYAKTLKEYFNKCLPKKPQPDANRV